MPQHGSGECLGASHIPTLEHGNDKSPLIFSVCSVASLGCSSRVQRLFFLRRRANLAKFFDKHHVFIRRVAIHKSAE